MQPDLSAYDYVILACSGGKDSVAAWLHLLDLGCPSERIEIWHHDVDGQAASFMDWPSTTPYVQALARYFGSPCYLSWRGGGLKAEILRDNSPTGAVWTQTPDGLIRRGGEGKPGTRLRFPQVSASLNTRYCSSSAKIDVADMALRAQARFLGSRTPFVTGERAEESPNRARYAAFEPHRTDTRNGRTRRHVDHWRPVHVWDETKVWDIIARYGVIPALPYQLGFGRLSCTFCIFMILAQAATLRFIMPDAFQTLAQYEHRFGCTMKRDICLNRLADRGRIYQAVLDRPDLVRRAQVHAWDGPVTMREWTLPAGAFGESAGPV